VAVNTLNVHGKTRQRSRGRKRIVGHSPDWKKAIVTLAPGQRIEGLFEGV
jgi:ribosomal protein L23